MSRSNRVILRFSAALLVLAPALLLHAQQSTATATLQGSVVNALTHQPIARALVSLDQYSQSVLTDNEGHFTFDGVPAGQSMLSARRPGYADDSGNSNTIRQTVTVPSSSDVTLELTPQGAITGEILLPGDEPPDSLQLQLLHQELQNGRAHWTIYRGTEASSEGRFRFGNLAPGAYLVHVGASLDPMPARLPDGSTAVRSGYVPVFYPNAREVAAAGVVTLSPGQQADIKMELTREPFYPVTIPVANVDDARGVGFEVTSDSFLGLPARFSPADGMVHIDLPAGHYVLEAHGFGPRGVAGQREFDVNGAKTARPGPITLSAVNRIPVSVHSELTHTTLGSGNTNGVPTAANQMSLDLQRLGEGAGTHGQRPSLQDDPGSASSGISQLVGVTPGKYWVNARAYGGYIASITSGGVDLLESPLIVSPDGSASPIDVTIRDDYANLSLTLSSTIQASTGPLYVHLVPQAGPATSVSEMTLPVQPPSMTISNVPPGGYLVYASGSRREIEYRNPNVLLALVGKSQSVSVEPGGNQHVTLEVLADAPVDVPAGGR